MWRDRISALKRLLPCDHRTTGAQIEPDPCGRRIGIRQVFDMFWHNVVLSHSRVFDYIFAQGPHAIRHAGKAFKTQDLP